MDRDHAHSPTPAELGAIIEHKPSSMNPDRAHNPVLGKPLVKKRLQQHPRLDTFAAWMALILQALATPVAIVYRNQPLSEEAIFQAIAKALAIWSSNPNYFLSPAHLLNWLKQTAYWRTIDCFRKSIRCPERPVDVNKLEAFTDPRTSRPRAQRWSDEDQKTVWICVQQLPPLDRLLIEGHYYDHLTDRDLAKVLYGTASPSPAQGLRVWNRRKKAEALLRQFLEQRGVTAA